MSVCNAALLLLLAALPAVRGQGSAGAMADAPITAASIMAASMNPAVPPQRVVELVLTAPGRQILVNSSKDLWHALQAEGEQGITSVELQGDVALDADVWSTGTHLFIPPGRVVVIRGANFKPEGLDISSSADAIERAGAATLNFAQREEAIIVEGGSLIAFEGLILTNQEYQGAWRQHQLATGSTEPRNIGMNPGIICRAGCMTAQQWTYSNFWLPDCSAETMQGLVYRVGILVGNTSQVVLLNSTAYALVGAATFDVSLLSPNSTEVGKAHVDSANSVFNCNVDPTAQPSMPQPVSSSSGPAVWVWVVVAIAATAALAVAATSTRWLCHRRQRKMAEEAAAAAAAAAAAPVTCEPEGAALVEDVSQEWKDVEKGNSGPNGEILQEVWSRRNSQEHGLVLLEQVGRGGFATVWRARWNGNQVAAKLIEHGLSSNVVEAIRSEAALSASVAHPNVVATYAVYTLRLADLARLEQQAVQPAPMASARLAMATQCNDDSQDDLGATVIVQELCSRSVAHCMEDGQVLYMPDGSPDQVAILRMLIDAAQGLDYLASTGVVHGDVKAANVLLTSCGNRRGWQAKVADLGLSRMLPPDATSMSAPQLGTAAYMAPELISQGRLTRACDVYSFSILMYEVWSRRHAWEGLSLAKLTYQVVAEHSRPPVPADCPAGYAALMQQCWAPRASDRPTFEAVIKALQALLRQLLQAGVPDSAGRSVHLARPQMASSMF